MGGGRGFASRLAGRGLCFAVVPHFPSPRSFCYCLPIPLFGPLPKKVCKNIYFPFLV